MASLPDPARGEKTPADPTQNPTLQTASAEGEVPPPPPEMCTECVHPGGHHFFTTVAECLAIGGVPFGNPFPCPVTTEERAVLASKMGLPLE